MASVTISGDNPPVAASGKVAAAPDQPTARSAASLRASMRLRESTMQFRRALKLTAFAVLGVASATLLAAAVNNSAPVIDSKPYPVAEVGQAYRYEVHATDPDRNNVQYSVVAGPAGMAYSSTAKAAIWTPTPNQIGLKQVTVRASDSWGAYSEQSFTLRTVADFCEIYPIAVPQQLLAGATAGAVLPQMVRGTGAGNFSWLTWTGAVDSPTLAASLLPPGNSYDYVNPDNGADHLLEIGDWAQGATGSMNASEVRDRLDALKSKDIVVPTWASTRARGSSFDYRVAKFAVVRLKGYDLSGQGWLSFEFRGFRNCYNDAPVSRAFSVVTEEDHPLPIALQGSDPDGDALSYTIAQAPQHGTLQGSGATRTYTPAPDYYGADSFAYIASDGEFNSQPATVSITVSPVNDAPVAEAQQLQTLEDVVLSLQLSAVDVDGPQLVYSVIEAPQHGTLSGTGANLSYLPDSNYFGTDAFTFRASDGQLQSTAIVAIKVVESNDPPVALNLEYEVASDTLLPIHLLANDPDGDALAYRTTSVPSSGALSGTPPNLTYKPDPSFSGVVSFSYLASDGRLNSAAATVTIQVTGANHPPKITSLPAAFTNERTVYSYDVDAVDPDEGDVPAFRLEAPIAQASIDPTSGVLQWSAESALVGGVRELNKACRRPVNAGALDPVEQWNWTSPTSYPLYNQVMVAPLVGQLSDDNGDGKIDLHDNPDVVVTAYPNGDAGNFDAYLSSGVIRILDGKTGSEVRTIVPTPSIDGLTQVALADIDGDGDVELVFHDHESGVQVLRNDGSLLWRRAGLDAVGAPITNVADLDGDGHPEIITGSYVLDYLGNVKFRLPGYLGKPHPNVGGSVSIADVDGDGKQEIIAGSGLYGSDGSVRWQHGIGDGFTAVGNIVGDSRPEIVLVHEGGVYVLDSTTGAKIWGAPIPEGGFGGAPTLADMDGDGELEIGVAGAITYTVFNANGTVLWSSTTDDTSSQITGSTVFDLDGDGEAEVIYNDEHHFRIYRGRDGKVLFETLSTSGTIVEYPIVANIDDDPEAEIIVGSNSYFQNYYRNSEPSTHGVRVFQSATRSWMPTRSIWNQYDYKIDNINDDGTVPAHPAKSWLTHNTYRLNRFVDRDPVGMADLALFDLQLDPLSPATLRLTARNRGLAPSGSATVVRVYNGSSASAKLLATFKLPSLASGEERALRLDNVDTQALGDSLYATIDDVNTIAECVETNNSMRVRVFHARATDRGGLYARQVFTVGVLDVNDAPQLQSAVLPVPHIGQKFRVTVKAVDPDIGDGVLYRLDSAPVGMSIDAVSGEVRWTPLASQAGANSFTVRATDLRGASVTRQYSTTLAANRSPVLDSTPVSGVVAGQLYRYDLHATDPDGDVLSYLLTSAPPGMTIDASSGAIAWTPAMAQAGAVDVSARVQDANGGAVTQTWTITVALPENHAPTFASAPLRSIALGQRYDYDADAVDADGDVLRYELLEAPTGMAVDTVTGLIVWQPNAQQIGAHSVRLQVTDGRDGVATQEFTILVSAGVDGGNHPPTISSAPPTAALIGAGYAYGIVASDIDGDALHYALQQAPSGMSIDAQTGAIAWTPAQSQAGLNQILIAVDDGRGGTSTQAFSILASTVPGGAGNRPPAITSDPLTLVTLGQTYRYYPSASDPDGDALQFTLLQAPAGMSIDTNSGVIAWTPAALGAVTVTIGVSDGRGGSATQSFTLGTVATDSEIDHRPVLISPPSGDAKVGVPYTMPLQVVDADGDPMTFDLVTAPAGATVDAGTGLVSWTPSAPGQACFTVRITSGDGYTDVTWCVEVVSAETPLSVHVVANPERVAPGAGFVAGMEFSGAGGPISIHADLGGTPVALDADGQTALVAPDVSGYYRLTVTIDDGNSTATDSADLFVSDPSDTTPPGVAISSPAIESRITAPTPVFGEVSGDDVARWRLSLLDKATGAMTRIAEGDQAAGPGVLGKLDPTLSSNGFYALVLQAWDASGNVAQDSRTVMIDGEMKLGHFSVSFEDVSLPMAGFPVRVTRTYDTRRRDERLDFGYGWSVDAQNLRLTESRVPGYSWTLVSERSGFFGNWCVRPNGDPIVAVTAPDGKLLKFRAKAMPECQFAAPQPDVQIVFEPLPGTDAQLDQTDYGIVRLTQVAGTGVYNLLDMGDTSQSPANPNHYRLKLPDGTVYSLTQGVGITQVADPDGNTLTYSSGGIKHSLGQQVTFLRDGQGRIEQIVLPDGRRRRYTYTAAGDLEIAVDAGADLTSFSYLPQAPHYLRDIIDPRGVRVSRNEYDDDGRLVATIDADGHRIEYTHNLDGRLETIRDRRGNASVFAYDAEGRVTAESNALGETILHSYDGNGNELTTTDPLGHVTRRSFDPRGNVLTETDPLGHTTRRSYDDRNNLLTQTDALGRVVATNAYHAYNGKLVMTQDALGNLTSFGYDSGIGTGGSGELTSIVDASNNRTRYEMNFFGQRAREFDADDNETDFVLDVAGRVHGEWRKRTKADGTIEALGTTFTLDDKDRITQTLHPDGSRTTVAYDGNGKPIKSCDALQRCTVQEYDARGELAKTTYPDGTFETSVYDENGNVTARTDRGGRVTKMRYDAANRLVETILPDATPGDDADNPRTGSKYDAAGRMTASIDERGKQTEYGYDDAGRRIWVKDALGHVTNTDYDAAGQRIAVTDALGHSTGFVYDLAGRLTETIYPDGTPASLADNPRTRTEYDALGRKAAEIDELGRRKLYQYDALGRLVKVLLPNPRNGLQDEGALVTNYVYDEAGNKTQQIDALGRVTRWEYDAMGRQTRRTLPMGQSETMQYDGAGQLVAKTDFNGVTTRYSYDAAGRLAGTDYAHDADVITTYTPSGQRESVTDGQGITLYQYDARDRLVRVQYPDGNAIAYGYDAAGNRTSLHSPAQDQAFVFDALNRLLEVHARVLGGADRVARYGYDAVGNRTMLTQADGTTTTTAFDERNRLRSLLTRTAAGVLLFGAVYGVDATGARTGIAESDASGPTRSVGYAYDGVKRLTAEIIIRPGQSDRATEYSYDAVGNRLTKTDAGTLTTYTVDDNDRMLSETASGTTTIYTYDANGNTTGQAKPGSWTRYTFDEASRLVRTQNSTGLDVATGYGAEGVRNQETVVGSQVTTWLIDSNRNFAQTIEAYVGTRLTTAWTYGNELLSQASASGGGLHERNLNADGMGSVRQATDAVGQLTDTFEYDAFGNELARAGASEIDHRYRGEQIDSRTGLINLRARLYDAREGRFLTGDPGRGRGNRPASLNRYVYGESDPIGNADPSGWEATLASQGTSISVSAVLASIAIPTIATIKIARASDILLSRAAARACAATYASGLQSYRTGDCPNVKMPIVFMSDAVMPGIGSHVLQSQALGSPAILHRTQGLQLTNRAVAQAKCRIAGLGLPVSVPGNSCDEYPFASTIEGGFGTTVAMVPLASNLTQGGVLTGFYSSCAIVPNIMPWNEFLVLPVASAPANFECRYFGA